MVVASSKGGVGKTTISVAMAMSLRDLGWRAGLLDLDLTNPSCHHLLGSRLSGPLEDKGLVPPVERGIRFLSIAQLSGDKPLALRGHEVDEAVKEILAVTRWPGVEVLVIDTPPGLGDEILDVVSLVPRGELVLVATNSLLATTSLRRAAEALAGASKIAGVVENMRRGGSTSRVEEEAARLGLRYLGSVPYVEGLDELVERDATALERLIAPHVAAVLGKLGFERRGG